MTQGSQVNVGALWKYVTDQVKAQITQPSLWRAMEAAVPVTVENDELVLGFSELAGHQSGLLTDNRTRNVIEQVLEAATRRRLRLRIISGTTMADWDAEKAHAAEAVRLAAQSRQQFQRTLDQGNTWEAVGEQVIRKFGALSHRALASVQGAFLEEALQILTETHGRLMPETPSEADERSYSRVLERVAERTGVPSALIAHMVYSRVNSA